MISTLQVTLYIALVAVILNLSLSFGFSLFATHKQKHPPNGAAKLDFWDQVMHMLVHHKQVPLTSSLIVFALFVASALTVHYILPLVM